MSSAAIISVDGDLIADLQEAANQEIEPDPSVDESVQTQ